MKIYFTASLSGKKEYGENYQKIIKALDELDFDVEADHIMGVEYSKILKQTPNEKISFYKKTNRSIKSADLILAEVSFPSVNVGHEITLALDYNKPVIALHLPGKEPHLLEGIVSEKLKVVSYTLDNLKQVIEEVLDASKSQMDVRFNFFIPPKIGAYLDWIAKHKKLPRAVFLRRLIEEHMRRNKEYKD
jgi:hypothetical protein